MAFVSTSSSLMSFICHAASDEQACIRKYAMNFNFLFYKLSDICEKLHEVNHKF